MVIFSMSRFEFGIFGDTEEKALVVLDLSLGILYCDERFSDLRFDRSSIEDPTPLFTKAGWKVEDVRTRRVAGAVVSFVHDQPGSGHGRTQLFFLDDDASDGAPFRR